MPLPAPWRLDPAAYPHLRPIQTRFQDLDVLGHINNVAFVALFESARARFNHDAGLWEALKHRRAVVAQTEVNYLAEGSFPDDVEVGTGILEIGAQLSDRRRDVPARPPDRDLRRGAGGAEG